MNQCALALGDDVSWIVDSFLLLHFKSCNPRNAPQEVLIWPILSVASQCSLFLILSKNYMAFLPSKSIKLVLIASRYSTYVTFCQLICKIDTFFVLNDISLSWNKKNHAIFWTKIGKSGQCSCPPSCGMPLHKEARKVFHYIPPKWKWFISKMLHSKPF